jgi:hypothetical protein
MQIAGMGENYEERAAVSRCKSRLSYMVDKAIAKHGAPVTVAALGELTAERSYVIAGPDLTILMLLELAKQIASYAADKEVEN